MAFLSTPKTKRKIYFFIKSNKVLVVLLLCSVLNPKCNKHIWDRIYGNKIPMNAKMFYLQTNWRHIWTLTVFQGLGWFWHRRHMTTRTLLCSHFHQSTVINTITSIFLGKIFLSHCFDRRWLGKRLQLQSNTFC